MNKILRTLLLRLAFIAIGFFTLTNSSQAQQDHVYNQFFMNPYVYNPAYAGVDGHSVVFAMYKQQWSNIPSGSELAHASFHTPMKGGVGIGVAAFNESLGPLQINAGKVSGSYLVNIDRKHFIRFGMSLGMGSNTKTLDEQALGDIAFNGESTSYLIGDFGATYHFDHFNIGFSMPNLFSSNYISQSGFADFKVKPTDNMLFKMNYRGHINGSLAIEPHVLYRYSSVVPSQFEIATIVHIKHIAWVGGTYRQDARIVGLLGVKVLKKFAVGAAFELGNVDYGKLTGTSFEIHVGMHLGSHHKGGTHIKHPHADHHSKTWFITHSDKHLEQDSIRKANRLAKKFEDDQETETIAVPEPIILTDDKPEVTTWDLDNEFISRTTPDGDIQTGRKLERTLPSGEKEIIVGFPPARNGGSAWAMTPGAQTLEEKINPDGSKEVGVKWVRLGTNGAFESRMIWETVIDDPISDPTPVLVVQPTDTDLAEQDEHHEVTRGSSAVEFPAGIYLVGGSFGDYQVAEEYSDRMFHQGYRDVRVGKVNGRTGWYVVLKKYKTLSSARQGKTRIQRKVNGVWVLKVND